MSRPEKLKILNPNIAQNCLKILYYNEACDDWEKHLPMEDEIKEIVKPYLGGVAVPPLQNDIAEDIAAAIARRIWGEKTDANT